MSGDGYEAFGSSAASMAGDDQNDDPTAPDEESVLARMRALRAREEAARRVRLLNDPRPGFPDPVGLTTFLAEPPSMPDWRITGLLPAGGRVLVGAARKTGKSTLMGNLVRSLVDGDPFLGRFAVVPSARRVVLLDNELHPDGLRRWLADQRIANTDQVTVWPLRGRVRALDALDVARRREWASWLADLDCGVLILDCLRPVLDAYGLSEQSDVGPVLGAWDELLDEGGVDASPVVHHYGHATGSAGTRPRGDSRLRDWPDAEWSLRRTDDDDDRSARTFSAFGRDVDLARVALDYDPATRRLTVPESRAQKVARVLVECLIRTPGRTSGELEVGLSDHGSREVIREAITLAKDLRWITVKRGARGAHRHYVIPGADLR